jgi:hypothetical protein
MNDKILPHPRKIDKKHIAAMILFAIRYIPNVDRATLNRFLELVNLTGSIGWITEQQFLDQVRLIIKYVPGTCEDSLFTIIELLDVCVPLNIRSSHTTLIEANNRPKMNGLKQTVSLERFTQR